MATDCAFTFSTVFSNLEILLLCLPLPSPAPLAGEKGNQRTFKSYKTTTLIISKQINKAMTKQYIYIYRYKKERKMCNDSSIILTQKSTIIKVIFFNYFFTRFFALSFSDQL